jgi:hypothetical protein
LLGRSDLEDLILGDLIWVEQRFQRCVKDSPFEVGFSGEVPLSHPTLR